MFIQKFIFSVVLLTLCIVMILVVQIQAQSASNVQEQYPYSVDETHITVWNGEDYAPLFIKGVNLGVAVPGTFAGDLAATREQYRQWFRLMRDAGFNTIRIYTIHFPRFYEELRQFNLDNPSEPLLLFQGVWLEENLAGYDDDLHYLNESFSSEITSTIDVVHGNAVISPSPGKADGSFSADVSPWVIGYIIGREIHPPEVIKTNELHSEITSYNGNYLSIEQTNASEAWLIEKLDLLLTHEWDSYGTQRPVSASSWPTLDPLDHPSELNPYEDSASIDFSNVDFDAAPAGFFVSYHAYPYYPRFVSTDQNYVGFRDYLGQNSYLGYLTYLKQHYPRFPLIIAEFGGSSSWGVAKYAHNGIHHGGYSEKEQGEHNIRMLNSISESGTGGGIAFSWIDEWFKRTWITDPLDYNLERRIIWHNVTAAEQNFGLLGFQKPFEGYFRWQYFAPSDPINSIDVTADFSMLLIKLNIPKHIAENDTIWVSIDTYDRDLGESLLPNGEQLQNRAEFLLMITNYKAELYVTKSYDTFAIWHGTSSNEQVYQSTVSDSGDWRLVRWKNDAANHEVQDIGSLRVNRLETPPSSVDGVRLHKDHIEIRLPYTLLNFVDPSRAMVLHDDRSTVDTELRQSDGISLGLFYNDFAVETDTRYRWELWNHALAAEQYIKESYNVVKSEQRFLPGNPIARSDVFDVGIDGVNQIEAAIGLLSNDWSLDGSEMMAMLTSNSTNGLVNVNSDGSFTYKPDVGFTGTDSFRYRVRAGGNVSEPVSVTLNVSGTPVGSGFVGVYPNPTTDMVNVTSASVIDEIEVYTNLGQKILSMDVNSTTARFSLDGYVNGLYHIKIYSGRDVDYRKILLFK